MTLESVRLRDLITITAPPQVNADPIARRGPKPISSKPGRRITRVPKNPVKIAAQRDTPTSSLKIKIARTVAKIGAAKESAITSASGVIEIA